MEIVQFVAEALGDASYLVVSGDVAAVVDPQRDVRPYRAAAAERGARIDFVFETHVHNDYLSGGRELAAEGAVVVAPAAAGLAFPHWPIDDGMEVVVGTARLRAVAAPGHTYEHTAYLALDEAGAVRALFSGGSILVGSAGRTDLLGPEHTAELTRLQWESARKLRGLVEATTELMPTHGAGSFCSTSGTGGQRLARFADELRANPLLDSSDYEAFRAAHLAVTMPIPGYYRHMAPINRAGPAVYGVPPRPPLVTPGELRSLGDDGAHLLDVRSRADYAAGHVPGSLEVEESGSLLAYVGWLIPFNAPLALVSADDQQAARVTVDLFRIGYEDVRGYLPFATWKWEGWPVATLPSATLEEAARILHLGTMPVLDVRFAHEHELTPLEGALPRPIDALPAWVDEVPRGPVLVVCASGQRATMAASILRNAGRVAIPLVRGGAADLQRLLEHGHTEAMVAG